MADGNAGRAHVRNEEGDTNCATARAPVARWERAHTELLQLARRRAGLDWEEGQALLRALRLGAHVRLGCASFSEYVERLFGYSPRFIVERLRVAEALEELPALSRALSSGDLGWSTVRELTRVATGKTEAEWIAVARGRTARDVEKLVAGHRPGDSPRDPADPAARRRVVRLELSGETLATFREAFAKLRRETGEPLDDDAAVLMMSRYVLGGPSDDGRASYQIAITVCEDCGRGRQQGRGELVEVGREVVEMATCDAQHIGGVDAHGSADTHVGISPSPSRATQTIPPARRRQVLRRDGGRCVVPGCRHAVFVDVHHIRPKAEGGDHALENLATLCAAHHRAIHSGSLITEGDMSSGLVLRHADGSRYGATPHPAEVDARSKTLRGLRNLGFRETEARRAIERAVTHVGRDATVEKLLRQSLRILTAPSARPH